MPMQDLPIIYEMSPQLAELAEEAASKQGDRMGRLIVEATRLNDRPNLNDVWSVAAESIAAQLNVLAYRLKQRREEMNPELATQLRHEDYVKVLLGDVQMRALTRHLQRKDVSA